MAWLSPTSLVLLAGALLIIHSGYSNAHFRKFLETSEAIEAARTGTAFTIGDWKESPPLDVVIEAIVGLTLWTVGVIAGSGRLLPVKKGPGDRRYISASEARMDFTQFGHRGIALRQRLLSIREKKEGAIPSSR